MTTGIDIPRTYQYQADVSEPNKYETQVKTRGVRLRIPESEQFVDIGAEQKDGGPWTPPCIRYPSGKILEAQWQVFVGTVERALKEYQQRFPSKGEVVDDEDCNDSTDDE